MNTNKVILLEANLATRNALKKCLEALLEATEVYAPESWKASNFRDMAVEAHENCCFLINHDSKSYFLNQLIDGKGFLGRLRKYGIDVPVMIYGYRDDDKNLSEVASAKAEKQYTYLQKPLKLNELLVVLQSLGFG